MPPSGKSVMLILSGQQMCVHFPLVDSVITYKIIFTKRYSEHARIIKAYQIKCLFRIVKVNMKRYPQPILLP